MVSSSGREQFLLGQAGGSQKAEGLLGIIHLRGHWSVMTEAFKSFLKLLFIRNVQIHHYILLVKPSSFSNIKICHYNKMFWIKFAQTLKLSLTVKITWPSFNRSPQRLETNPYEGCLLCSDHSFNTLCSRCTTWSLNFVLMTAALLALRFIGKLSADTPCWPRLSVTQSSKLSNLRACHAQALKGKEQLCPAPIPMSLSFLC